MCNLFGVTLFDSCVVNWSRGEGYMYPQYMCILLYVTLIWCNRYFIDVLSTGVEGICILSICAFLYM